MSTVKVVSYQEAKRLHIHENVLQTHNIVSLLDTGLGSPFMCSIYEGFPEKRIPGTLLTIHIDDVIKDEGYYRPWTRYDSTRLMSWLGAVQNNKKPFLVHCWMGISRSGAVGTYIAKEVLKMDLAKFFEEHPEVKPNIKILESTMGIEEAAKIKEYLQSIGRDVCKGHD